MPERHPDEPVSELYSIPIHDNCEPLVPFLSLSRKLYWTPRHPVFAYERLQVARQSVAEKLAAAAESLPDGILLAIVEGWRSPEIQQQMYAATRTRLRAEHPDWPEGALEEMVQRFSAPMHERVPPPHTTGGAVDVSLITESGELLDFISPYSIMDPRGAPAFASGLSAAAERSRELLRSVMLGAGLTNYPAEWWHWSYGDQGWAYRGGHSHALYAAIEPEGLEERHRVFRVHDEPGF